MELKSHDHSSPKLDCKEKGDEAKKKDVIQQQQQQQLFEAKVASLQSPCTRDYDHALSLFGCGVGWFCFVMGFVFPPLWYYATFLFLQNNYLKDPRERPGLAASAIAAFIFSVILLVTLIAVVCSMLSS